MLAFGSSQLRRKHASSSPPVHAFPGKYFLKNKFKKKDDPLSNCRTTRLPCSVAPGEGPQGGVWLPWEPLPPIGRKLMVQRTFLSAGKSFQVKFTPYRAESRHALNKPQKVGKANGDTPKDEGGPNAEVAGPQLVLVLQTTVVFPCPSPGNCGCASYNAISLGSPGVTLTPLHIIPK